MFPVFKIRIFVGLLLQQKLSPGYQAYCNYLKKYFLCVPEAYFDLIAVLHLIKNLKYLSICASLVYVSSHLIVNLHTITFSRKNPPLFLLIPI